jgi:predicted ATPase
MTIATDRELSALLARATPLRGWALATSGHEEEGITQIRQGLAASQAMEVMEDRPYHLALLAEAFPLVGQTAEGLEALAEALATLAKSMTRWWEAGAVSAQGRTAVAANSSTA